jgi:hypothetical protein
VSDRAAAGRRVERQRGKAHVADRVTFIHGNLFEADIRPATVVILFLLPRMLDDLLPTLKRDLRPGARIVTRLRLRAELAARVSQDISGLNITSDHQITMETLHADRVTAADRRGGPGCRER